MGESLSRTQRRKQQRKAKPLRERAWRKQGMACFWCHEPLPLHAATGDHVVEMRLGGRSKPANVVAACETCNNGRSNRPAGTGQHRHHVKAWRRHMFSIGMHHVCMPAKEAPV